LPVRKSLTPGEKMLVFQAWSTLNKTKIIFGFCSINEKRESFRPICEKKISAKYKNIEFEFVKLVVVVFDK
jgi:hypothetical protein